MVNVMGYTKIPTWFPKEYWTDVENILVMISRVFSHGWSREFLRPPAVRYFFKDIRYYFKDNTFWFTVQFKNGDMYWQANMTDENDQYRVDTGVYKKVKDVRELGRQLESASDRLMEDLGEAQYENSMGHDYKTYRGASNTNLRKEIQKIAAKYPETRKHLIPLLKQAECEDPGKKTKSDGK